MTPIYPVLLAFTPEKKMIYLRELTAQDELGISDLGTVSAVQLINRLHAKRLETETVFQAETLVAADRDRLLAAVYKNTYKDFLQSTVPCAACSARFDLDFSLDALINHIQQKSGADRNVAQKEVGWYELPDGVCFRLPTGEDEFAVAGLPPQYSVQILLERCVKNGDINVVGQQVQEAMAQIAPVLATEMSAQCPECGHEQTVYFDIQSFLLSRLMQEKKQTVWEIHRLATAYHWTHSEILNLPRSLRRNYVSLIDAEL